MSKSAIITSLFTLVCIDHLFKWIIRRFLRHSYACILAIIMWNVYSAKWKRQFSFSLYRCAHCVQRAHIKKQSFSKCSTNLNFNNWKSFEPRDPELDHSHRRENNEKPCASNPEMEQFRINQNLEYPPIYFFRTLDAFSQYNSAIEIPGKYQHPIRTI